jgi:murein DD-endopeptidase MepM/ murein hydrolase activator NlpD
MRHLLLWTTFAGFLILFLFFSRSYGVERLKVRWAPVELKQGEVLYVEVKTETEMSSIEGDLDGSPIFFYEREGGGFAGIAGVDLAASPSLCPLRVRGKDLHRRPYERVFQVKVKKGTFGVQRLTLPREKVELTEEVLRRVLEENREVKEILLRIRREKLWHNPFIRPLDGPITSPFGLRRILNGKPRSPHSGVDISAPLDSIVFSCNDGIVVFVKELYLGGKTVIIDHGFGLFSIYMHLSEILVKEGEKLRVGDSIGLVGSTGRATGPHLHWGMRLIGARIDPLSLLKLFTRVE